MPATLLLPKITHDQIRDAIQRSGYLLEYRLEQVLRRRFYMVEPNQAYPDPITGKSRELDIAAMTAENLDGDWNDILFPRLLIECINNPQPMAFFTKEAMASTAHVYDFKLSGFPVKMDEKGHWKHLSAFLDMQEYHHHCKGKIATQYCSFTSKKNKNGLEWLAQHETAHFDSFSKLCFALNHEMDEHVQVKFGKRGKETINLQMYYLILVVSGELMDISPTKNELKVLSTDHIHYVQSYVSKGKEQRYHIDVVTEKYFPRLLKKIEAEVDDTAKRITHHRKDIQASMDKLVASVRGLRSRDAIRARLNY